MFKTMAQVRKANKANGYFFFSRGAMKCFNSRVESNLISGRYFITSEQFDDDYPRDYAVREVEDNADIFTVGERYASLDDARKAINELI